MDIPEVATPLLRLMRAVHEPRARLLCFPYAGGASTVFFTWPSQLPTDIEVRVPQLPGRHERLREAPWPRIHTIVDNVLLDVSKLKPLPTVIFGHSFGAVVAFEVARRLQAAGTPARALVVGAQRAPQLVHLQPRIHHLPKPQFLRALHERYGTSLSLLEDSELMDLCFPSLRADMEALETYEHVSTELLNCPVVVLRGRRDTAISATDAAAWAAVVGAQPHCHEVDGAHFFVDDNRPWVLDKVSEVLRSVLDKASPPE